MALAATGKVKLSNVETDKYGGRVLADVETDGGGGLGRLMLATGLVRTYGGGPRRACCNGLGGR